MVLLEPQGGRFAVCIQAIQTLFARVNKASIAFCAALCYAFSKGVDKMDARTFGNYLSRMRKAQGMTQAELAEQLHVTDKAVSRWERGESLT